MAPPYKAVLLINDEFCMIYKVLLKMNELLQDYKQSTFKTVIWSQSNAPSLIYRTD